MMLGGSSSAVVIRNGTFDLTSPGRFDRASCVAASGGVPRPGPAAGACGAAAAACGDAALEPLGDPHGGFGPDRGGVAGRILNVAGDMKITPLRPTPFEP